MKRKLKPIAVVLIILFLALWFSDVLPKPVAGAVASVYLSQQENGAGYKLNLVEYSSAHDAYFAYFSNPTSPELPQRNVGVFYRYFPLWVAYDSAFPG